jgi:hypothetical protein
MGGWMFERERDKKEKNGKKKAKKECEHAGASEVLHTRLGSVW